MASQVSNGLSNASSTSICLKGTYITVSYRKMLPISFSWLVRCTLLQLVELNSDLLEIPLPAYIIYIRYMRSLGKS